MARSLYGATPADVTFDSETGALAPEVNVTIWNARTGGSQITDLQSVAGAPITLVTSDEFGFLAFYGPDGSTATLWADGDAGSRVALFPIDASNAASFVAAQSVNALADVDTATVAPTDGQVLTWDAGAGKWEPADGGAGGGLAPTVIDAKGDLIVGTADNTVARLPVGADGKVLTAASGDTPGVKWQQPESYVRYWNGTGGVGTWEDRGSDVPEGKQITWRSTLDTLAPGPTTAEAGDSWLRAVGASS